jgi:hypothetical protein
MLEFAEGFANTAITDSLHLAGGPAFDPCSKGLAARSPI